MFKVLTKCSLALSLILKSWPQNKLNFQLQIVASNIQSTYMFMDCQKNLLFPIQCEKVAEGPKISSFGQQKF